MRKPRIFMDSNLTPLKLGYPCHDTMRSLGFEPMFMVYDGTLNRAKWWANDDLTFRAADDMRPNADGNYSNPPDDLAVKACAKLAQAADTYVPNMPRNRAAMFDLEGSYWAGWNQRDPAIVADFFGTMTHAIKLVKETTGWQCRAGAYGWPPRVDYLEEHTTETRAFAAAADFVAPSFYTVPPMGPDPCWFDQVQTQTAYLDRFFSHLPRIAVINPTYQVYWIENYPQLAHLNEQPVPAKLWKDQLRFLIERDYDLFVWTGGIPLTPGVAALLKVCAGLLG